MYTMKPVIYAIQNPLGEKYIGSTVEFAKRRTRHKQDLRRGQGVNALLRKSWELFGDQGHTFTIVASVFDPFDLHSVEADVMQALGADLNVNRNPTPYLYSTRIKHQPTRRNVRRPARNKACAKYGVATHLYTYRRANNWTVAQALNLAPHPPLKGRPPVKKKYLTAGGRTLCMDDWAKLAGTSKPNIDARLARGCTPEQAVGLEKTERELRAEANAAKASEKPKRQTYTLQGVTGNISELAAHFGVPYYQLSSRQRMGWPEADWLKPKGTQVITRETKDEKAARYARPRKSQEERDLCAQMEKSMRDEFAELLGECDHR